MDRTDYEVGWLCGVPVVVTPCEIDVSNAAEFRRSLISCYSQDHATLIVDMSATEFCDSMGLHQLVRARKRAMALGGDVHVVARSRQVLRLFAITGIDRLFRIHASLDEAAAALGMRTAPTGEAATVPRTDADKAAAVPSGN